MGAAPLDAGELAPWLERTRAVLAGEGDAEVPCGDCTACCSSAQFVAIEADEVDTLARVPSLVTVPAPGRPGTVLLGYDAEGRCPMLGPTGCTIYEVRPRACRMFDCRVFAAAGLAPERPEAAAIGAQVRRWRFRTDDPASAGAATSVRAAAAHLVAEGILADGGRAAVGGAPGDPPAVAVALAAVEVHELFLGGAAPAPGEVTAALRRRRGQGPDARRGALP